APAPLPLHRGRRTRRPALDRAPRAGHPPRRRAPAQVPGGGDRAAGASQRSQGHPPHVGSAGLTAARPPPPSTPARHLRRRTGVLPRRARFVFFPSFFVRFRVRFRIRLRRGAPPSPFPAAGAALVFSRPWFS